MSSILPLASVVTEKSWKEFLLTKFSFELYHQAEWYISCDKKVEQKVHEQGMDNVVCLPTIEHDDCDHNTTDAQKTEQWMKVMMTKFDACEKALVANSKVLFLDSDMLFVNSLGPRFRSMFHFADIDAMICPHMTGDYLNEGKHGYYNAGMFVLKSRSFLNDWRELSSMWKQTGYYFEQKPLEFVKTKYMTVNLPISYNFGWWRLFLGQLGSVREKNIHIQNDAVYFHRDPIVNFHTHMLKEDVSDQYSTKMRDIVLANLKKSNNNNYKKILETYEDLRSQ